MAPFRVIPAMDLLEGSVVRLFQGDYGRRTTYPVDPVDLAQQFLDAGLSWVHMIDLEGARLGKPVHLETVTAVVKTGINIELGGGLRSEGDIEKALNAGASEVILGTSLLAQRDKLAGWLHRFGGKLVAGVDSRAGRVAIRGWSEGTRIDALLLLGELEQLGFSRAIVTDIATDGALQGPNLPFLQRAAEATAMEITASGGIASPDHLRQVADLAPLGITGVIVGRAYYEGAITLAQMAQC